MDRYDDRRHPIRSLLALAGVAVLWGCGNLTAGGIGEASVAMSADAPDPAPSTALSPSGDALPGVQGALLGGPTPIDHEDGLDDDPEGQLEADLTVYLVSAEGELAPVTDGEVEVRVDLDGVEEPEIGSRPVTATSYTALRMVFTDIQVQVDAGLVIEGDTIVGPVDVEIDDVSLTVEKPIDVLVADGQRVELLIDLNADAWLQALDPVTLTVDAQTFADLVAVRLR